MRRIIVAGVIGLLSGCSATGQFMSNSMGQCMSAPIGPLKASAWCAALPESRSKECACGSDQQTAWHDGFKKMHEAGLQPRDILVWFSVLPEGMPIDRAVEWMTGPIPAAEARAWVEAETLPPDAPFRLYKLGISPSSAVDYISLGLSLDSIEHWHNSSVPQALWAYWMHAGISATTAQELTAIHNLYDSRTLGNFLATRNFREISMATPVHSWICSRGNLIAQVVSVSSRRISMIQRYRVVDFNGYQVEEMALFKNFQELSHLRFSSYVRRTVGVRGQWSLCPPKVLDAVLR